MALKYADRVAESTATTGLGSYTLGGAKVGFRTFADGVGDTNMCYYTASDRENWEVGLGTVSGNGLSRDQILASSNSGLAVEWGEGNKDIFCTLPADAILLYSGGHYRVDEKKIYFGSSSEASVSYDGMNMLFNSREVGTGNYLFTGGNVGIGPNSTADNLFDVNNLFKVASSGYITTNGSALHSNTLDYYFKFRRLHLYQNVALSSGDAFEFTTGATGFDLTASSGEQSFVKVTPTISQSGTANYVGFLMNVTENTLGSGSNDLMNLKVGGTSKFVVRNDGKVGIGTTDPQVKLDVRGATNVTKEGSSAYSLKLLEGKLDFTVTDPPTEACTAADAQVAGNVAGSNFQYKITYVTMVGETLPGPTSNILAGPFTNTRIILTNVPVSPSQQVTARKIYRNSAFQNNAYWVYVGQINDNTTATYEDNAAEPGYNQNGTPSISSAGGSIGGLTDLYVGNNTAGTYGRTTIYHDTNAGGLPALVLKTSVAEWQFKEYLGNLNVIKSVGATAADIVITTRVNGEAGVQFQGAGNRGRFYTKQNYDWVFAPNGQYASGGNIIFAATSDVRHFKFQADNSKAMFGAGDDASIYYDGTDLIVNPKEVGTGTVKMPSLYLTDGGTIRLDNISNIQVFGVTAIGDLSCRTVTASVGGFMSINNSDLLVRPAGSTGSTPNITTIRSDRGRANQQDRSAGTLYLETGVSTGTGVGDIVLKTATPGVSGTQDNSVDTRMTINSSLVEITVPVVVESRDLTRYAFFMG